jgi:hypothetical protein
MLNCLHVSGVVALLHHGKKLLNFPVQHVVNLLSGDVKNVDSLGDHINVRNAVLRDPRDI